MSEPEKNGITIEEMLDGLSCAVMERAMSVDMSAEIALRIVDYEASEKAWDIKQKQLEAMRAERDALKHSLRGHKDQLWLAIARAVKAEAENDELATTASHALHDLLCEEEARKKAEAEAERLKERNEYKHRMMRYWESRTEKAETELAAARPLLAVVDKCEVEDLEYCVNLYKDNPDPDPALDIVRAALAYRNAKNAKKGETA